MSDKKIKKKSLVSWGLAALLAILVGAAVYIIMTVLSEDSPRKKRDVAVVTLLKPPPVPVKEKLPEPERIKEVVKKEEIISPVPGPTDEPRNAESDDTPAGENLSLDAEGTAGSDGFGLGAKKGGRSLLAGGGDGMGRLSMMSKFGWYNHIVETEIRKVVMKFLDERGGMPKGKLQAVVRVSLDNKGSVVQYKIIGSSGNHKMDDAVIKSLVNIRISEPPPEGMPRTMNIRVTSHS